jgi:hypothetical protein
VSLVDQSALDVPELVTEPRETPCARLIGVAGTGKTYTLLQRTAVDPTYGMLTSTTGISAINLGAVTLNARLGYFDTRSMRDVYLSGRLARVLHGIARTHRWLVIEEYSMLDADQLDLCVRAVTEANRYKDVDEPLGILLVGDLAQLPPVRARWCFEAVYWDRFVAGTTRLTKVHRQSEGPFLDILNLVRSGDGAGAADILRSLHVTAHTSVHTEFDGTTILPKNAMVNRYNMLALARLKGAAFSVPSRRWGAQRPEWGENPRTHEWGIPPRTELKVGAYVMILANNIGGVNGTNWPTYSANSDMPVLRKGVCEAETTVRETEQHEVLQPKLSVPRGKENVSSVERGDGSTQSPRSSEANQSGRDADSGGISHSVLSGASEVVGERSRVRASSGDGEDAGTSTQTEREGSPQERGPARQSSRESATGDGGNPLRNGGMPVLPERFRDSVDGSYANGDCGTIVGFTSEYVYVQLVRNGAVVGVPKIIRDVSHDLEPAGWTGRELEREEDDGGYHPFPHFRPRTKKYVTGQIEYLPMRLAYASTVHKSQSLTLDRVQVDFRDPFFSAYAMMYVALSRCRTLEGLRLVGSPDRFIKSVKCDPRVIPWL